MVNKKVTTVVVGYTGQRDNALFTLLFH